MGNESRTTGWWVFAGVILGIAGVLNLVWGIAAVANSKFFTSGATYVFSGLHAWGWVTLVVGVIQLIAAFSLFSGGGFGRWIGIFAASIAALDALMTIGVKPFWSLCVFALAIIVIYELAKAPERRAGY